MEEIKYQVKVTPAPTHSLLNALHRKSLLRNPDIFKVPCKPPLNPLGRTPSMNLKSSLKILQNCDDLSANHPFTRPASMYFSPQHATAKLNSALPLPALRLRRNAPMAQSVLPPIKKKHSLSNLERKSITRNSDARICRKLILRNQQRESSHPPKPSSNKESPESKQNFLFVPSPKQALKIPKIRKKRHDLGFDDYASTSLLAQLKAFPQ